MFVQLCDAVRFAHAHGVLHRDLKPANVLLGPFGEVLVSDWGLAIPLPGPAGAALVPLLPAGFRARSAGTPMYMSPEQARGDDLDARADVYALGTILYELVALRPPFEGGSLRDLLGQAARGEVRPLAEAAPTVSKGLAAVVAKAMACDRDRRYGAVAELADEIETVLDGRTPDAENAALLTQAARYYVGRDPALARLRVVDVDLWIGAAWVLGLGMGALAATAIGRAAWALVGLGVALSAPTTWKWLRLRRERAQRER